MKALQRRPGLIKKAKWVILALTFVAGCDYSKIYNPPTFCGDDLQALVPERARFFPMTLERTSFSPSIAKLSGNLFVDSQYQCDMNNLSCALVHEALEADTFLREIEVFLSEIQRGNYEAIELNSSGGNVLVGLYLANAVHDLGIRTIVQEGDVCMSSCVYVLMAGSQKMALGEVGVHQIFIPRNLDTLGDDERASFEQTIAATVATKVRDSWPVELHEFSNEVSVECMAILTREQKVRFGLLPPGPFDDWVFGSPPR